jgi:hypothetical protein
VRMRSRDEGCGMAVCAKIIGGWAGGSISGKPAGLIPPADMAAYLIFTTKGKEFGRRPLSGPVVVGRSPECDISVRDILLSRQHCRIEPDGDGWALIDLQSKNGTRVGSQPITRHTLHDGDVIRIGKTIATFRSGAFVPSVGGNSRTFSSSRRPADPWEALAGTVSGFDYAQARLDAKNRSAEMPALGLGSRFPNPQPSPPEPDAYEREDLYAMLSDIASSSWDSIYMNASRPSPVRPPPRPMILGSRHPRRSHTVPVDLSLQVGRGLLASVPVPAPEMRRNARWRRRLGRIARGLSAIGQMVMVYGMCNYLMGKC